MSEQPETRISTTSAMAFSMMCIGIVGVLVIVSFSGGVDKVKPIMKAFSSAEHVQLALRMQYALVSTEDVSKLDLGHGYYDSHSGGLRKLKRSMKESGIWIETGFPDGSVGQALVLSNYVLTGNESPQFLVIPEIRAQAFQRRQQMIEELD